MLHTGFDPRVGHPTRSPNLSCSRWQVWARADRGPRTMYIGEPQSVAAIMLVCRYLANPKSAAGQRHNRTASTQAAADRPPDGPQGPPPHRLTNLHTDVVGVSAASTRIRQQNVLGLQVPMDDTLAVQQPHGASNLLQEEPDGVFTQGAHGCGETGAQQAKPALPWTLPGAQRRTQQGQVCTSRGTTAGPLGLPPEAPPGRQHR